LPAKLHQALLLEPVISELALGFVEKGHCLFLGRGIHYPLALEGALKLKEISYIHAEGYAGGELKHGPIALIDRLMPIITMIPFDAHFEKMRSNLAEVATRGGKVFAFTTEGGVPGLEAICERVLVMPTLSHPAWQAMISVIPLQLFAYYTAVHKGTDVDQPRNLAKSVTVE
jgi:glucosamine--fructose-6-phosphate aminotransferase (isomerizing)